MSVYDEHKNNRTLLVQPSFPGKAQLMLKILSRKLNRDFCIITESPPEQYSNSRIKIKQISEEIKVLNEYGNAIIVFDNILGTPNSKYIDQFFIRGRENIFDKIYLLILFWFTEKKYMK